jgi:uncharacterized protein with NAD-binding domain and iron-sulfur cluster
MTELTRRTLVGGAGVVGAAAAVSRMTPALALTRKRVAVLGGGMAGLAAAHELVERGFEVTVYERKALGGKARSIPVPGSATGGRKALPGEHGFRFFPGFYHHVPDTMRRIPFGSNPNGVGDNLVSAMDARFLRSGGRVDSQLFGFVPDPREAATPDGLRKIIVDELVGQQGVSPIDAAYFATRLLVFLTSSDVRRFGQWEKTSWWDFVDAESRNAEYQQVAARGMTRALVAAKEEMASTRTIGNMAEAFLYTIMGRGRDGAPDRVLNAPTNEAWINPWVRMLKERGVAFRVGQSIEGLEVSGGRIVAARSRDRQGVRRRVEADWFVCAMPVERARKLWNSRILSIDPSLERMDNLYVDWMNGVQFYLRERVDIAKGHLAFLDSPWSLTALTQGQFWENRDFKRDYGDGQVADCLSVDISDWDTPGVVFGKPAKRCTRAEIRREVWTQIKQHLEDTGESFLPAGILHSWFLDPAIQWDPATRRNTNDEPLLVNTVNSWKDRPSARTKVSNLFLAGDYVRTDIDLATMEGANESGRAAVNALLDSAGSAKPRVEMFKLYDPPEWAAAKLLDAQLYRAGQPNLFDALQLL